MVVSWHDRVTGDEVVRRAMLQSVRYSETRKHEPCGTLTVDSGVAQW